MEELKSKLALRRKRFATNTEVIIPNSPVQRFVKISTKESNEDWEFDTEGDHREDGRHILKPKTGDEEKDSFSSSMMAKSLDEIIYLNKVAPTSSASSDNVELEALDSFIERRKLTANRRTECGQVSQGGAYNPNASLDEIIKSEKFEVEHSGMLARLEHDKKEKVKFGKPGKDDVPFKRVREETAEEKWEDVGSVPRHSYGSKDRDWTAEGITMDALKVLEVLTGAGNRIKIMSYTLKDPKAEIEIQGSNWLAQRWIVEIFLIGMDETGKEIGYMDMGRGAANKKILAKYAAAEDLYASLKRSKYITNFPHYFIPAVHRLSSKIYDDVQVLAMEKIGASCIIEYNTTVDMNTKIPVYCTTIMCDGEVLTSASSINREHTHLMSSYKGYSVISGGEKYKFEAFLKGQKVGDDFSEYRCVDTQEMTVATIPFHVLDKEDQENILRQHRNDIIIGKFGSQQTVEKKDFDKGVDELLQSIHNFGIHEKKDDSDLEHSTADEYVNEGDLEIHESVLDDDMELENREDAEEIFKELGIAGEDEWDELSFV